MSGEKFTWSAKRSEIRILEAQEKLKTDNVQLLDFEAHMASRLQMRKTVLAKSGKFEEPLFSVPENRAIITDSVHIYANLMDFDDHLRQDGVESENSHMAFLEFLHTHYSACDHLANSFDVQRVDFHGSRLHAVVLQPEGPKNEYIRIEKALKFSAAFRALVAQITDQQGSAFRTRVRIGIDSGKAVAISSGRGHEKEPLFIGSPANHAAKAAAGDVPGLFLTGRAQAIIDRRIPIEGPLSFNQVSSSREAEMVTSDVQILDRQLGISTAIDNTLGFISKNRSSFSVRDAKFSFLYKTPPLSDLVYAEHPASNTIRQEIVSIFADIDNFTNYIDTAIRTNNIVEATSNLFAIRNELAAVLQKDFSGRKVRFVGDCIHGVIAVGDNQKPDNELSVKTAVVLAGALRSSFNLCIRLLPNCKSLGLAIGLELGVTPICRLGLSGKASVRCSSSASVCVAEDIQLECARNETAIGPEAYAVAPYRLKQIFDDYGKVASLGFSSAVNLIGGTNIAAASVTTKTPIETSSALRGFIKNG